MSRVPRNTTTITTPPSFGQIAQLVTSEQQRIRPAYRANINDFVVMRNSLGAEANINETDRALARSRSDLEERRARSRSDLEERLWRMSSDSETDVEDNN